MKRIVTMIVMVVIFIISLNLIVNADVYKKENRYEKLGTIVELDYVNDTVKFVDNEGYLWVIHGSQNWVIHDHIKCTMSDNGTEGIEDDKVLKVKKIKSF